MEESRSVPQTVQSLFLIYWVYRRRRRCSISKETSHVLEWTLKQFSATFNTDAENKSTRGQFSQGGKILLLSFFHAQKHSSSKQNEGKPSFQTATVFTMKQIWKESDQPNQLKLVIHFFLPSLTPRLWQSPPLPGLVHFLAQHVRGHVTAWCHICQLTILQDQRDRVTGPK